MTITYVIPGARTLDQLNEPTLDHLPDENARENCVAASLAEGLDILTGKTFYGDELKDAVYGEQYIGPTAAVKYVTYCHDRGVDLAPHNGSQANLIATIHSEVAKGHPVIVTMPSNWSTAPADPIHPSGYTHVGLAVGVGPGEIRVMNPWHGFMQDGSDAWWQARLCYGQVWTMKSIGVSGDFAVLDISQTNGYFTQNTDGSWACKNGHTIHGAILTFYRDNAGFRLFGLPITNELTPDPAYAGRVQVFERGAIAYDPQGKWDHVATETDKYCYAAHIDNGFVAQQLQATLKKALDSAYMELLADAHGVEKTVANLQKLVP